MQPTSIHQAVFVEDEEDEMTEESPEAEAPNDAEPDELDIAETLSPLVAHSHPPSWHVIHRKYLAFYSSPFVRYGYPAFGILSVSPPSRSSRRGPCTCRFVADCTQHLLLCVFFSYFVLDNLGDALSGLVAPLLLPLPLRRRPSSP